MSESARPPQLTLSPEAGPRGLGDLYSRHWREIVGYIQRTCGAGPPDPEDAAQAAFTKFAELSDPGAIENPRAFLFRSARNFVVDQKRRAKVRGRFQAELASAEESEDQIDAARVLEAKEYARLVTEALKTMRPDRAQALVLHRIEGMSFSDVAKAMSISPSWAKKLALQALIECDRAIKRAERR